VGRRARNPAEQGGELAALRVGQARGDRPQLVLDLGGGARHERPPRPGQFDPHRAAVVGIGDAFDQAAPFGAVDQAGDARLVELEVTGEDEDPRFAVAEDPQQPHLDDREVVALGDPAQHPLDQEGGLDQRVDEAQFGVGPDLSWRSDFSRLP
jgi:hypothetical protein